jgi:hypothetical protein
MQKKHPRMEVFDDCFPGKCEMSDVDGWIERNGRFILTECVSHNRIEIGQYMALMSFVRNSPKQQALVYLCANISTMDIRKFAWVDENENHPRWQVGSLDDLKLEMKRWADWAWNAPMGTLFDRHFRLR